MQLLLEKHTHYTACFHPSRFGVSRFPGHVIHPLPRLHLAAARVERVASATL